MNNAFLPGRKRLALVLATALLSIGATAGTASAATTTFSNTSAIRILDDTPADPYPSTIDVSGYGGNVQKVTVTLNRFSHTFPNDIAVLLVGPSGANSILMGRVGGSSETGLINLTFDQAAANTLNTTDTAVSGTYKPSQGATTPDPFDPPAPGGPYPVDLNEFNNKAANGIWRLFIDDQSSGDTGFVGSWSLAITGPRNTVTAGTPKLNKKKGTAQLPVTVGDAGQLTLSGKGVKSVRSAGASKSVATAGPGTVNLVVKPKGKTSKKLNSAGKATVNAKITFTPTGGAPNTTTKKIKLKKTLG
jgi:subtilisin-like proprotein convertase family protein